MTEFSARVLSVVRRIPAGRVATYGDVAEIAGRPGAARAVGNIMRDCRARDVPCHRVVAAAGRLGGFGGQIALKRSLLEAEGITIRGARIRNFSTCRWAPPPPPFVAGRRTPQPLTVSRATRRRHGPV